MSAERIAPNGAGTVLIIHSHYGDPIPLAEAAAARTDVAVVRERDLRAHHLAAARGVFTTSHLDQVGFLSYRNDLVDLLERGGRWFFNGHILRELLPGLGAYVPIPNARRADYVLTRLNAHPILAGVDPATHEENRGVAGFYGRGHNPPPPDAIAVTGLGPDRVAIDWEWTAPGGGKVFCHSGNDLASAGKPNGPAALVSARILAWLAGEIGE